MIVALNELGAGDRAKVADIRTDKKIKDRLGMLNVFIGGDITLLKKSFGGRSVLIDADGVRVGMRKDPACKIFVERLRTGEEGETDAGKTKNNGAGMR